MIYFDEKNFGRTIRKAREDLGMTQCEASKACGLSDNYYGAMERGYQKNPTVHVIVAIANRFGIPIDAFFLSRIEQKKAADRQPII